MKVKQKRSLSQEKLEEPNHSFFEAIGSIKNAKEAELFLSDLCTPAELQAMVDRWAVVDPIKEGKPYRKIHEETGVSVTTIGRVARFISYGKGGYNIIYNRVKKKKYANKETKNRNTKKREVES